MEDKLITEILRDPQATEARFVYADWLDDLGDPRAEYLRSEIAFSELDENDDAYYSQLVTLIDLSTNLDSDWLEVVGIKFDLSIVTFGKMKLDAVKIVKIFSGRSLMDAKRLTEQAPTKFADALSFVHAHSLMKRLGDFHTKPTDGNTPEFGFRKSADVKPVADAEQVLMATGKRMMDLQLESFGDQKLETVKLIQRIAETSLLKAKKLAESCPCIIMEKMGLAQRKAIQDELTGLSNLAGGPVFTFVPSEPDA